MTYFRDVLRVNVTKRVWHCVYARKGGCFGIQLNVIYMIISGGEKDPHLGDGDSSKCFLNNLVDTRLNGRECPPTPT